MTALVSQSREQRVLIPSRLVRQESFRLPSEPTETWWRRHQPHEVPEVFKEISPWFRCTFKKNRVFELHSFIFRVYPFLMQEFSWSLAKWRYKALQFTYWFPSLFLNDDEHRRKSNLQTLRMCLCSCRKQTNRAHCAPPDMRSSVLLPEGVLDQLISM